MDLVFSTQGFESVVPLAGGRILGGSLSCFGAQLLHPENVFHFNFFHVSTAGFRFH